MHIALTQVFCNSFENTAHEAIWGVILRQYITYIVLFIGEARLDAILIHGVDDMSTKDVFAYFSDFAPGSVEWIDDSSCKYLNRLISNIRKQILLPCPQTFHTWGEVIKISREFILV